MNRRTIFLAALLIILPATQLQAKELVINCRSEASGVCFSHGKCDISDIVNQKQHRPTRSTFILDLSEKKGHFRYCDQDDQCGELEDVMLNISPGGRLSIWNGGGLKLNQTFEISGDYTTYSSSMMTTTGEVLFAFGKCQ
jgi:hypothetical protein